MATNAEPDPSHPRLPGSNDGTRARSEGDGVGMSAEGTQLAPVVRVVPPKLSQVLEQLIEEFATRPVTLREVIAVLQGRAYLLLMLLLSVPFLLPVPLPGLSTVLGFVVAAIALRITLGQKPWLPARVLDRELPPKFFPTLLNGARRLLRFLEVMLKPRMLWLTASPMFVQLHALVIFIAAFVLLLPLPPGTNFPPAVCIVIMAGGLLERDGRFILAGYLAFALNGVMFAVLAKYIKRFIESALSWISG